MPLLEMKTRPIMCSSREEHISLVCHRPSKITKCSHPQDRITEATIVLDASILQNASSCPEVPGESTKLMESNDCVVSFAGPSENSEQILETSPLSPDTARRMVVDQSSSCPSIDETIFSPILEQDEAITNTIYDDAAVSNLHVDLPHLVADEGDDSRCDSNAYPSCSVSDYSISELCVPAFSFDETMGFSGLINNMSPDYDHINSELTFDMEDRYMMLPFIEKTVELNVTPNECREVLINVDDPYLYVAIHQLKQSEQETEISFNSDDMAEPDSFDPHLFIKMPEMSDMTSSVCPIMVPKEAETRKPVTLVLDLDETLVHSTLDPSDGADFTFLVFFNMMEHTVYVRKRPHLHAFLERVAQMFEIVIFTASQSIYAAKLLDILDPDKKLISRRIYRESCVFSEGSYVKDLTVLGIDLAKVMIIDNCPQVFRLQVNNGIPIKSWFDDPSDKALVSLLPFLETLVDVDDVRPIISKKFSNKQH